MLFHRPKKWSAKPPVSTRINWSSPQAKGLVGFWSMREGGGATTLDSSGKNNTGTLTAGPVWAGGRAGTTIQFDGVDDYVNIPAVPVGNTPAQLTVSFWVNGPSQSAKDLFAICSTASNNPRIDITTGNTGVGATGNQIGVFVRDDANVTYTGTAAANYVGDVFNNRWHHVAFTYTQTLISYYIDGVFVYSNAYSTVGTQTFTRMGIAALNRGTPIQFFNGKIDDVRLYNRVLSAAEIESLYVTPYDIFVPQSPRMLFRPSTVSGIQFDAAANSGYQAAASTYTFNRTCTGSNRYLTVDIALLSAGQTVTSVVDDFGGGAVNMTFIGARSTISSVGRIECWGLVAPVTGTKTIQVNLSGTIASSAEAVSYTGVHQTLPYEAFNSNQATNVGAADATVAVTPIADSTWIHAAVATDDTAITAAQTSRNNVSGAGGSGADEDTGPISPAALTTMSYTNVGALATWAIAGYAIRPITASGPAVTSFTTTQFFQLLGLGT